MPAGSVLHVNSTTVHLQTLLLGGRKCQQAFGLLASILFSTCRDSPVSGCREAPAVVGTEFVPDANSQGTLLPTSRFLWRDTQVHLFHSSLHAEDWHRTASTQPSAWCEDWWLEQGRGLTMAVRAPAGGFLQLVLMDH